MSMILSASLTKGYLSLSVFDTLPLYLAEHPLIQTRIIVPFKSSLSSSIGAFIAQAWVLIPSCLIPANVEEMLKRPVYVTGSMRLRRVDGGLLWSIDVIEADFSAIRSSHNLSQPLVGELAIQFEVIDHQENGSSSLASITDAWIAEEVDGKSKQLWYVELDWRAIPC